MKVMIPGFPHRVGVHCTSAAVRDVLEHLGVKLSEEMVFGLGCGLNFLYSKNEETGYHYVLGRGDDIEGDAGRYLGAEVRKFRDNDLDAAVVWMKRYVALGIPVIVNHEASRLAYVARRYTILDGVRYGGHRTVLAGYDDDRDELYLYDYGWAEPQTAGGAEFKAAMAADTRPSTHNLWIVIRAPREPVDLAAAIRDALRTNAWHMINPWIGHSGLRGLRRFTREVTGWPRLFSPDYHRLTCSMVYMMLEAGGTGGGNFRRMYGRFLKEAAAMTGIAALEGVGAQYHALAKLWSRLADLIRDGADGRGGLWADLDEAGRLLGAISAGEAEAAERLGQAVGYEG